MDDLLIPKGLRFEYGAENKLVRAVLPGGDVAIYRYDGLGRRVEKEVTKTGVTTITRYIYDNEDILLELGGNNQITARYTHGPGIDEPLILEKSGQSFFYHADGLGSITEITDTVGAIKQQYTYSSFGKIESQLDPNFVQPYTFTARELDSETGIYFYRERYYDSSIGRFLQEDPLGFAGGDINLYRYVRANPISSVDPLGLSSLVYNARTGQLSLISEAGIEAGMYVASNNAAGSLGGVWPQGVFGFIGLYYRPERPDWHETGKIFVHFDVPNRTELGVHAGRQGVGATCDLAGRCESQHATLGCIRTTLEATEAIRALHKVDPLKRITVIR